MSTRWCSRIFHEEFGPMEFDELLALALAGTLGRGDLVRRETEDVWTVASMCPELRSAFSTQETVAKVEDQHNEASRPSRSATESAKRATIRMHISVADSGSTIDSDSIRASTSRQRWIVWTTTAGSLFVLFIADRLTASASPTFPPPRRVREQLADLYWYLGIGPWSLWECLLLWLDSLVVIAFISTWLTRRLAR